SAGGLDKFDDCWESVETSCIIRESKIFRPDAEDHRAVQIPTKGLALLLFQPQRELGTIGPSDEYDAFRIFDHSSRNEVHRRRTDESGHKHVRGLAVEIHGFADL